MAFIRAILYYLNIAICLFVIGLPYMFYRGVLCRRWSDSTRVCIPFFNTTFKLFGIKVEIEGKENIPDHKQFVIVANHQSFLDINVIWPTITITSFIAKAELWKIPVFGWVLNKIGCIPVHKNPRKNLGMGAIVKKRLEDNVTISVFPEGHRSNDGHMFPFQNGIFRMAKENKFPLLPVTLVDTGKRLSKTKWAQTPGVVKIVVHPLQTPESFENKSATQLRDEIHNMISSALPYRQADAATAANKEA
ncbi:lysophospholipid acyltransferase family protein [Fibrobacter sp.]|uniref:lysophospholipid acyltransferase family protein n=1 Tax=Fibrobacter sp. TaxID=35828 RepID=UPI002635717C|nr:lysophospholipid acyltransferase family protein [Fibrobacter sp.]MDD5942517.1 lysophospholipid acyltransferase family protein [Fibrobacter sp.]